MLNCAHHRIHQFTAPGEERLAGEPPLHAVTQLVFFQQGDHAGFDHLVRQFRTEAEVELDEHIAGDHVVAAGTGLYVGDLHACWREKFIAFIPLDIDQLRQHRRRAMDRVIGKVRIGNMALHAVNGQVAGQRAAAAVFHHIADHLGTGGFADQTVVQTLITRHQRFHHFDGAVFGAGLFI